MQGLLSGEVSVWTAACHSSCRKPTWPEQERERERGVVEGGPGRVKHSKQAVAVLSVFTLSSEKPVMGCEKRGRVGGTLVGVGE